VLTRTSVWTVLLCINTVIVASSQTDHAKQQPAKNGNQTQPPATKKQEKDYAVQSGGFNEPEDSAPQLRTGNAAQDGTPRLTAAILPSGPADQGSQVDLRLSGTNLDQNLTLIVTGPTNADGSQPHDVADQRAVRFTGGTSAYATIKLNVRLDPNSTYTVHLSDSTHELNSVSLDLENLVVYRRQQDLEPSDPTSKGSKGSKGYGQYTAWRKRVQAEKINRQTAADERLLVAAAKAAEVERQMYLFKHQDVTPQSSQPLTQRSTPSSGVPVNDYCRPENTAESTYIHVRRSVVDPKEASDSYGRRLGRRFLVFEVTVENTNPNLQYMLHDVSVDLSALHNLPFGTYHWSFSGQDLIMLRGVPEKGSDYDPRNLTLHIARGVGAVAGGVTGLTAVGIQDIYGGTVAAYNGPVLTSFLDIFPDHTATQLNRLSDSAFTANTVVAKQSAKTFAIFVPEGLFMTHGEQKAYWKEPIQVFDNPGLDFRKAEVCVDGAFISEVPTLTLASAAFDSPTDVKPGADAAITITGTNLAVGDTVVDLAGGSFPVKDVSEDGKTAHATVTMAKDWVPSVLPQLSIESKKTGFKTPPLTLNLGPVLNSVDYLKGDLKGPSVTTLSISGKRMKSGDTELLFNGQEVPVNVSDDGGSGTAQVTIPAGYDATTPESVSLKSKTSGYSSTPVQLAFTAPSLSSAPSLATGSAAPSANVNVKLTFQGSHLIEGDTHLLVEDTDGKASHGTGRVQTSDGKNGIASVQLDGSFDASKFYKVILKSVSTGKTSGSNDFPSSKPQ
jgi:hypothetical protein